MRNEEERGEKSHESSHSPFLTSINSITKQSCTRSIVILEATGSGDGGKNGSGESLEFLAFLLN